MSSTDHHSHSPLDSNLLDRLNAALAGRYRLEREIGSGGMATVYLAEDLKHQRKVAIKVLLPDLGASLGADRFLNEIKLTASLSHPHILPLHDSGEANGLLFYVMPYVEGETLRQRLEREGPLPLEDAARIAAELADALEYAHGLGVVHRDIKPENILLRAGHAVVADFGIARAVAVAGGERLTQTGVSVGTPTYMSPEQGLGETLDARSDIYAMGCVVFEMLTGDVPFPGTSPHAILARKAVEAAPSLRVVRDTIPIAVEDVVSKALAKVPADRYSTAAKFREDLERSLTSDRVRKVRPRRRAPTRLLAVAAVSILLLAAGWWIAKSVSEVGAASITSLAVMPLENLSGDPEQEHFITGMHDALIGQLAQIGRLRVISRRSTMPYRQSQKSVPEIAGELNVDLLVEASVERMHDSVRIQVSLIEAAPQERQLWTQAYSREVSSVLAMHSEIARAIAGQIDVELTPDEETRLGSTRRVNPETYEAYLRGMYHLNQSTPEDFTTGLAYLEEAVEKNPGDPLAYAGLSLGYATLGHGPAPPPDAWPKARAAAERAVKLDSTLAEAYAALADVKVYYEWDWDGAERAFQRANQLNPSLAMNRYHHAWYLALFGRLDEAIVEHERARELDPLTPLHTVWLPGLYLYSGRFDEAVEQGRATLERYPDNAVSLFVLGSAYKYKGLYDQAIATHERMVEVNPAWAWALGHTYAVAGSTDAARRIAAQLEDQPSSWNALGLAQVYAALGETDKAFRWLAYEPPHAWLPWTRTDPAMAPLRDDPRFRELLRRMNLPD